MESRRLPPQIGPNLILDSSLLEIENTTTLDLTLGSSARGLSGFDIDISIDSPSLIQITGVTFPSYGLTNVEGLNTPAVSIRAVDLAGIATGALSNFRLASVTVLGLEAGEAILTLTVNAVDDDEGNPISVDPLPARVRTAHVGFLPDMDTESKRLEAVYSILESVRTEHNRVGLIASSNWEEHEGRFQTYKDLFREKQSKLLIEQRRLLLAVRRVSYTDEEWGDFTDDQRLQLDIPLYGDRDVLRKLATVATSRLLQELKDIPFLTLTGAFSDPLEDFTTYTEIDPNGVVTVDDANTITIAGFERNDDFYVFDDAGSGHFDTTFSASTDSAHLVSSIQTVHPGGGDDLHFWQLANVTDPTLAEDPLILTRWNSTSRIFLAIDDGALDEDQTSVGLSAATRHWMTNTRNGSGVVVQIYDDSGRTSLQDTISVSQGTSSFQYIFAAATRASGGGTGTNSDGQVFDLDLQEAVAEERRRIWVVSQRRLN